MATPAENAGDKQGGRFQKGQSGNPRGKPPGTRHRVTVFAEKLMADDAEAVVRQVVEAAKAGDMTAARLILDRLVPPRKGRPVAIDLPAVTNTASVTSALGAVIAALGDGVLTPDEAAAVSAVIETQRRAIETVELETRLRAIEEKMRADGQL